MTVDTIIEQAGIPLLLLVICVYYAIRLIVLHDSQAIRGKNKPPVKDEEAYCKAGRKAAAVLRCGYLFDGDSGVCECLCGSGGDHNLYGDSRHSLEADGGSVRRLNE